MYTKMDESVLMKRLLRVYVSVCVLGVVIISLHNTYINQFEDYFGLKFIIKCGMGLGMIAAFQIISYWRLRRVRRLISGHPAGSSDLSGPDPSGDAVRHVWSDLLRFPEFVFKLMLILGILYSPAYHLLMIYWGGIRGEELQTTVGMFLFENLLFDQALTLLLAALLYIMLRRISREYLEKLNVYIMPPVRMGSVVVSLLLIFISLFLISMLTVSWFVMNAEHSGTAIPMTGLFLLIGSTFIFSVILFSYETWNLRRSLQELIRNIRSMLDKNRRHLLHGKMPIVTTDETGQLAAAFNQLQDRNAREYQAMEKELRLAFSVQQQLLPKSFISFDSLQVAGVCRPTKEVGGDLFDALPLEDGSLAVVIGDVSGKGVQAALIMSAVVVMLRTEVRRGGSPDEILHRLNQQLLDTLHHSTYVTLALAKFYPDQGKLEYASAGHVSPYLLRDNQATALDTSSLPLGVDAEARYQTLYDDVRPGDRFVFFTDGIVETIMEDGSMLGFDGLVDRLRTLRGEDHPEDQVRLLLDGLPEDHSAPYADDKTLVLVNVMR